VNAKERRCEERDPAVPRGLTGAVEDLDVEENEQRAHGDEERQLSDVELCGIQPAG
jgi:hypothetical protein